MAAEHGPETVCKAQERYCVDRQSVAEIASALGLGVATVRRWAEEKDWDSEREAIAAAEVEIRANSVKARAFALKRLLEAQNGSEASQAAAAVAALERATLERLWAQRLADCPAPAGSGQTMNRATGGTRGRKPAAKKAGKRADGPSSTGAVASFLAPSGTSAVFTAPVLSDGDEEALYANPAAWRLSDEERITLLEEAVNRQLAFVLAQPVDDLSKRIKEIKAALDVLAAIKGRDAQGAGVVVSFAEEEE